MEHKSSECPLVVGAFTNLLSQLSNRPDCCQGFIEVVRQRKPETRPQGGEV